MSTAESLIGETPNIPDSCDELTARHVRDARAAFDTENYDRAIAICERLLAQRPDSAEALLLLGLTSWRLDEPVHAVDLLRRAQKTDEHTREYADALATLLGHLGESTESLYFAKLATVLSPHPLGDSLLPAKFREYFKHLAYARPHIYRTRARDAFHRGALREAADLLEKQIELTPREPDTLRLATEVHLEAGALAKALDAAKTVIDLGALASDHDRLARVMASAGFFDAAMDAHDKALAQRPGDPEIAQSRLRTLALKYDDIAGAPEYVAACRRWCDAFAQARDPVQFRNSVEPQRRLRIGYAGAALHGTGLAPMLESVLNAHDPDAFEIYVYARGARQDMSTQNLVRASARWTDLSGVDPETSAHIMRNDGIDILVDLVGHGVDSHARTFAFSPAPVRLGWLGVTPASGGLYDAHLTVGSAPDLTIEQPVPHALRTEPAPAPPSDGGRPLVVGIVAPVSAIGPAVMQIAKSVLDALPGSMLLVANTGRHDAETMARIHTLAAELDFEDRISIAELEDSRAPRHAFFGHIDIALDTSPVSRFIETAEAIGAGVPVLAFPRGRAAQAISEAGHPEWLANSPEAIAEVARKLGSDRAGLARLRSELPNSVRASALFDPRRFVVCLEDAYRTHWRAWCESRN
ncbi:MAG: tetratricopeptide repeat protein [Alphaproteobacteria bacterium]|nr:tetratricopeptide repeat protein [Alphaproteobacteria bacterium]